MIHSGFDRGKATRAGGRLPIHGQKTLRAKVTSWESHSVFNLANFASGEACVASDAPLLRPCIGVQATNWDPHGCSCGG